MGESTVLKLAHALARKEKWRHLPGIACISREPVSRALELPSFEEVSDSVESFEEMYRTFYRESISGGERRLVQKTGDRYLVINPPAPDVTGEELDRIYELPYERKLHPLYETKGEVRALDTVQFSVTTHRGLSLIHI